MMARGAARGGGQLRKGSARKLPRRLLVRAAALTGLFALGFAGWLWWDMREWRPDEALYPEQGALAPANAADVKFATLKAIGARFVYLPLGTQSGLDPRAPGGFADQFRSARNADLQIGVLLNYDPCVPADRQSGVFAQMVPRDAALLPAAIGLTRMADGCDPRVSDAAVESELMTLINQVETHAGKPVILKLGRAFEARHHTAAALTRDLWLARDRARPDYAGRPWLLWSANSQLISEASEEPVEWVVVQK